MTFDAGTWWLAVLLLGFVTAGLVYLLKRSLFGRIDKLDEAMKEISENSVKKSDYSAAFTRTQPSASWRTYLCGGVAAGIRPHRIVASGPLSPK